MWVISYFPTLSKARDWWKAVSCKAMTFIQHVLNLARAQPFDLLNGVYKALAPPGDPKLPGDSLNLLKKGVCRSVYGYHASERSLGSLWI